MNLSAKLRKLRAESHLTQKEISDIISVPRTTFAGWENGSREPDAESLKLLADYYGVTVDFLLGRTYTGTINKQDYKDDPDIFELFTKENMKKIQLTKELSFEELEAAVEMLKRIKRGKTTA